MLQRSELPVRGDQRTGDAGRAVFIKGSPGLMTGILQGKVAIIVTHRLGLVMDHSRIEQLAMKYATQWRVEGL